MKLPPREEVFPSTCTQTYHGCWHGVKDFLEEREISSPSAGGRWVGRWGIFMLGGGLSSPLLPAPFVNISQLIPNSKRKLG